MRSTAIVATLGALAVACGASPAAAPTSPAAPAAPPPSSEGGAGSGAGSGAGPTTMAGSASNTSANPATPSTGSAAGLKPFQKEALDHFDEGVKSSLEGANKACGTTFKVGSDFSSYREEEWSGQSVSARCASVLDGLAALCGRAHYKPEVVKNVSEVKCLFGGAGSSNTKANLTHAGKTLTLKMHKDNANIQDAATSFVQAKLDGK